VTSLKPRDVGISEESEKLRTSSGEPRELGSIFIGDKTRAPLNTGTVLWILAFSQAPLCWNGPRRAWSTCSLRIIRVVRRGNRDSSMIFQGYFTLPQSGVYVSCSRVFLLGRSTRTVHGKGGRDEGGVGVTWGEPKYNEPSCLWVYHRCMVRHMDWPF